MQESKFKRKIANKENKIKINNIECQDCDIRRRKFNKNRFFYQRFKHVCTLIFDCHHGAVWIFICDRFVIMFTIVFNYKA